jgi:hypothetical protein
MNYTNTMNERIQSKNNCGRFYSALKSFYLTKEINIISVFLIIIIGLIGNVLAITVFIQKRFRRKSTEVFF